MISIDRLRNILIRLRNILIHGDCFKVLPLIPDRSVDFIITDPPYVKTECDWDIAFNIKIMWEQFNRIIKPNGCICVFGLDQFSAYLLIENIKYYRYKWIWNKVFAANFANFEKMPMRNYEEILTFYQNPPLYQPQMIERKSERVKEHQKSNYLYLDQNNQRSSALAIKKQKTPYMVDFQKYNPDKKYPELIIEGIPQLRPNSHEKLDHATQKPSELYEYLINTYTKPNMVVLDAFSGSGTNAIACLKTNRKFICIEKEPNFINMTLQRMRNYNNTAIIQKSFFEFGEIYSYSSHFDQFIVTT